MITWSDNYATGVARVDNDHKTLISMLNDLEQAIAGGRGSRVIGEIVTQLAQYAEGHFLHEEACMNRYQCPTAHANRDAHAAFRSKVAAASERIANGGGALAAQRMHLELSDWLISHVLKVDTALRPCVLAGKGSTAG